LIKIDTAISTTYSQYFHPYWETVFCSFLGRRAVGSGGAGALAKQLTLSQPGGQIMPTIVLRAPPSPPDFQTLRRPWGLRQKQTEWFQRSLYTTVRRLFLGDLILIEWPKGLKAVLYCTFYIWIPFMIRSHKEKSGTWPLTNTTGS
jgi:hypothetical protein